MAGYPVYVASLNLVPYLGHHPGPVEGWGQQHNRQWRTVSYGVPINTVLIIPVCSEVPVNGIRIVCQYCGAE